ncbi:MAG: 50S ribosomal protein L24 [Candidatus Harrisonbacteria bacterium]|nr:50S ribosomal protein L24 [Candidatus Harrisonbacteria bacterium]MBI2603996.1 50S ribosomal protein L24 [Candidatus Harrisonbacteria bacterium]MBI3114462.1 50S ribosomal protein L24 [Candidatus Harrisonbacteria bacterium]
MKLKKNDNVTVRAGKDRGRTGKILRVDRERGIVLVEGVMQKRHRRPRKQGEKGEIVSVPRPLRISTVQLLCPNCGKAARLGMRMEGETKARFCKKCQGVIAS